MRKCSTHRNSVSFNCRYIRICLSSWVIKEFLTIFRILNLRILPSIQRERTIKCMIYICESSFINSLVRLSSALSFLNNLRRLWSYWVMASITFIFLFVLKYWLWKGKLHFWLHLNIFIVSRVASFWSVHF